MPYASTKNPMNVHLIKMRINPAKKDAVPFAFCLRAKKRRVFWGPIIIVSPIRKRIYGSVSAQAMETLSSRVSYVSHGEPIFRVY